MALRIRLWQQGCTNNVCYRIVVADSRAPRDGKYVEALGWYNPNVSANQQRFALESQRLAFWLSQGALMTQTVEAIAKKIAAEVIKDWIVTKESRKVQKAAKKRAA
jgi:small subunit ribosomal protein S16